MTHDPQYADSWPAANEAGTHDPFCYFNRDNGAFDFMAGRCARCQLIAKVRADERKQAGARVAERPYWEDGWPENLVMNRSSAIDAAEGGDGE